MKNNYQRASHRGRNALFAFLAVFLLTGFSSRAQLLVPFTGTNSLACGTNTTLMDHAGSSNYSNNANGYTVLYAGAGAQIALNGTYDVEPGFDYIYIYDGVGTGGTLLQTLNATNSSFNFTFNPGQTITVRFTSDGSVTYTGFNFNVTYSGPCVFSPCSGTPSSNTVVATNTLVCPVFGTSNLSLAQTYSLSALSYSWQQSTAGALGPYTNIPNANGITGSQNAIVYTTPTLATTVWYQVVLTCTNGGITTTATPVEVQVAPVTINTVPYFEGFEGIVANKDLPNCSWTRSDAFQCGSRTTSVSTWRAARTGNKFAEFDASNYQYGQTRYFYSNGIVLNAGITYSASVWYNTPGYSTWYNLGLMYGPNQSPSGLVQLATVQYPNNSTYNALSNTFSVATTNTYYLAVRATEYYYGSQLVWDDLAITAPCQFPNNAANITLTGTTTICAGQTVNISASGANSYSWSTNQNGNSISVAPMFNTTYSVTGLNPLSGCVGSASRDITVNQLPSIGILSFKNSVCEGETVTMQAFGANSYTWSSNASTSPVITVTPTTGSSSYTVIGANNLGCVNSAVQTIAVNPLPVITVTGNTIICQGSTANLTASGAGANGSYEWKASTLYLQSNPVSVNPMATTAYTVTGVDGSNCKGSSVVVVAVDPCLGLENVAGATAQLAVYPNPNNGVFTVVKANGISKSIEVVDVTGRVVLSSNTSANTADINISALANGVYYVKVSSDNTTEVVKVVKH